MVKAEAEKSQEGVYFQVQSCSITYKVWFDTFDISVIVDVQEQL